MSALGQKRTFWSSNAMSALPPKADIGGVSSDVRFVPKADIRFATQSPRQRSRALWQCPDQPAAQTPQSSLAYGPSLQLIGNLVDTGLRAVVILPGCARDADRADDFVAHFDWQSAGER